MNELEHRKIIHVDMDAFFASVEQRDNPELKGIPLAVGGTGGRGVVAAASYEARKFGIHSAMPSRVALRICPMLKFVRPRFEAYRAVSTKIHEIFNRYTEIIEPLSLDEAYLDVTYSNYEVRSATLIAQQIKDDIKDELHLIASAGVSYNKFLAKIASDQDKPDGLFVITPDQGQDFVKSLLIEKFFGVGKVTARKMKDLGIFKGSDLLPYEKWELQQLFGKMGAYLYNIARGIDHREVKAKQIRKSIGAEMTFSEDIIDQISINEKFTQVFEKWWERYENHGLKGRTLTIKIRNHQFETITRSITEPNYFIRKTTIRQKLDDLWHETIIPGTPLRLIGVSITGFELADQKKETKQLTLW